MKRISLLLFILLLSTNVFAQQFNFAERLYDNYETFKEKTIQDRRFTHSDIEPLIKQLASESAFEVTTAGYSVQDRPIYLVQIGNGDTNVLFWSQMHGDESTATMALLDIFNFFSKNNGLFADKKKDLLNKVSLYFLPMLNPDGAEHFQRKNALSIDINRDAQRLTSPEARILKSVRDSLKPEFGFNLHDQSTYYAVGRTSEPATLSFLAPAYNYERSVNKVRKKAMRLIAYLNEMLQQYIPGKVAKYSDAHEPRAFGDMITKWGTSTVLIESGGYPDDPEKQYIRKLNFVTMLAAINSIANESYVGTSLDDYHQIPENNRALTDLLIREVNMVKNDKRFLVDIGIRQWKEVINDSTSYYRSRISNLGDLSTMYGYDELDGNQMEIRPGKIYPDTLQNIQDVQQLDFIELLQEGYTGIVVKDAPGVSFLNDIPLNVIVAEDHSNEIELGSMPNLVIKENGQIQYVIVNGFVFDTESSDASAIGNTLVID
ncbi:MAG TPA: M14 metallopeptidase family protein [Balneolaceae bacterium]